MSGSTFLIHGFFAITAGVRAAFTKAKTNAVVSATPSHPPTTSTYYMVYQTTIQCQLGEYLAAELRVYSPPGDVPLPNDTVVYLEARARINSTGTPLLDAIMMAAVPGDVNDAGYDDTVPDVPNAFAVVLGSVVGTSEELGDGSRAFNVEVSAHVCGQRHLSVVKCVYDISSPRWRNIKAPSPRSLVHVMGSSRHLTADHQLAVSVMDITFINGIPTALGPGVDPATPNVPLPPMKRKRFNAVNPAPAPSASSSASAPGPSTLPVATADVDVAPSHVVGVTAQSTLPAMSAEDSGVHTEAADSAGLPTSSRSRKGKGRAA